jgi:hypothetical protein
MRILAAILFLVLPLPSAAQGARADLLAADRAASELSSDSGVVASLTGSLRPTGVLLWPGAPVVIGPDETRQLMESIPGRDTLRLTWQPLGSEFSGDSMLAMTWGVAVTSSRRTPGPPRLGRYIAVWQRESARWTVSALLFMGIEPSVAALPADIPRSRVPLRESGEARAFIAADLAFARLAGDSGAAAAFRTWAAAEAFVSGRSGLVARGPEAIASGVAGNAVWRWHPVAAGASPAGDLGWTVGEAVITPSSGGPSYSKYLTIWTRAAGGRVRFLTDGGNPRPPVSSRR